MKHRLQWPNMTKNAEFTKVFLKVTKQGNNNPQQRATTIPVKWENLTFRVDTLLYSKQSDSNTNCEVYKEMRKYGLFKENLKIIRN